MALLAPQSRVRAPRRAIVFGGRDFKDREWLFAILDGQHAAEPFDCIIEGGQVSLNPAERGMPWEQREKWGADWFAHEWAISRGVRLHTVKADWDGLGKRAGPIRNQRMIDEFAPTEGVGFPGGRGSADMLRRIRTAGLDWLIHSRDSGIEARRGETAKLARSRSDESPGDARSAAIAQPSPPKGHP